MKILLAPDSFKGTLTSAEVIDILEGVIKRHFNPVDIIKLPIADGGEGTVDSLVTAAQGITKEVMVTGPLGGRVTARYGIIRNKVAVLEMAQASGLPLLKEHERNPLDTTTYGTGELIKAALDQGIHDILIGIGGSATNDGGIGAAQALGMRFLDYHGQDVGFGGRYLERITSIQADSIDPRIRESRIAVICDVTNPLTGPDGATFIYGPQKGATVEMQTILEAGMQHYAALLHTYTGTDVGRIPGAGAAGGLGAALVAFLGAKLRPGIDTILEYVNFEKLLEGVDLVITGEGRIDGQSVNGKVPVGVARYCKEKDIMAAAIVGSMENDAQRVYDFGIQSIMPSISKVMTLDEALSQARETLADAADRMFRFIRLGMKLAK